jgi:membrane protein required for colicin V production
MHNLAVIDIILAVVIFLLVVRCVLRGFVGEILSMAAVALGILAAFFLYKNGAAFIRTKIMADVQVVPEILAFAALFGIVFLLVKILEFILKDIIERIHLSGVDRFLGFFFGLVEGFALVALVLFVLNIQPLFDPEPILRGSLFAKYLLPLIIHDAPPDIIPVSSL